MNGEPGRRLARIFRAGTFCVTAEVVPPRSADPEAVRDQARALVGYADAVNVTDNPTASAHMSAVAGAALVAEAGLEPTMQLTVRDRNRLAITADLLGGWALGARNLFCLSGDPIAIGDHPDARAVEDLTVLDLVGLAARLRDEGRLVSGEGIEDPPRYLIGVADVPLADGYDPGRLEAKLDAGADFVMTQVAYDLDALADWADGVRARGILERAWVVVGLIPLRSAGSARRMQEHLPGVSVPEAMLSALEEAGPAAEEAGLRQAVDLVGAIARIPGLAGVHLMGMGRAEMVRRVVEEAGLLPRPTGV